MYFKMKSFALKVDLSTFFEDERKMTMILVEPDWKTVQCLQCKLQKLFDLGPMHFTTADDSFIPLEESVEILRLTSWVKAFMPKHNKVEKINKRKVNDFTESDSTISLTEASKPKKKCKNKSMPHGNVKKRVASTPIIEHGSHVYFKEAEDLEAPAPKPLVQFRCSLLKECKTKPRIFNIVKLNNSVSENDVHLTQSQINIEEQIIWKPVYDVSKVIEKTTTTTGAAEEEAYTINTNVKEEINSDLSITFQ